MATFTEIESRIRTWTTTTNTSILTPQELRSMANEIGREFVENYDVWFARGTETITVSGRTAAAPTDPEFARPISPYYVLSGRRQYPSYLMWHEFLELYPDASEASGYPVHYSYIGRDFGIQFAFGPTPTTSFTFYVDGYYYPGKLVYGGLDQNGMTRYAEKYLRLKIQNELLKFKYEDDVMPDRFSDEIRRAKNAILATNARMHSVPRRAVCQRRG